MRLTLMLNLLHEHSGLVNQECLLMPCLSAQITCQRGLALIPLCEAINDYLHTRVKPFVDFG